MTETELPVSPFNMTGADFSNLYGLVIGINKYKSPTHHNLEGCVGDAQEIAKYLTDELGVPSDNLVCLFDEEATRENILDKFRTHLIVNAKINTHDPIIIYYAGHGDRSKAPAEWHTDDGYMETLLPHDAGPSDSQDGYVYGIPDMTLGALLSRLHQEKGDNITVILDSCHSGSGTRGRGRARSSHDFKAPDAPPTLDTDVLKALAWTREGLTAPQSIGKHLALSLGTHILMAACQNNEKSFEVPKSGPSNPQNQGMFTSALLEALRECDPTTTSYSTLSRNVLFIARRKSLENAIYGIGQQTPQCEGRNQDRLLFSTQFSVSKGKIALIPTRSKGVYRIRVGSALGIAVGTEFGVYSSSLGSASAPITQLVAKDVGPTGAFLAGPEPNMPLELPADAYATVIRYNDHNNGVRILVSDKSELPDFWGGVLGNLESLPVIWAEPDEAADLVLVPTANGIELQRQALSPDRPQPVHIHLKHDLGAKSLVEILTQIIYFHFHLQRRNAKAPVQAQLGMTLRELQGGHNKWGIPQYTPVGADLFGQCLSDGTVATLKADSNKFYGLTLTNSSKENLFPYVLYYDLQDYSVSRLYDPPSRSMRAPLLADGSLSIGYGSGGADPFQVYFTNPSSASEYGAFVLLVFSEWVDIAYLQQESPLPVEGKKLDARGFQRKYPSASIWDKLCVRLEMVR